MFLGDFAQQATRIRETSIKGALTFWWRALHYAELANKPETKGGLQELQARECHLFGGPDGQGAFLLRLSESSDTKNFLDKGSKPNLGPGAIYLGYGVIDAQKKQLQRNAINSSHQFTIELRLKRSASQRDVNELLATIKAFGLLGGLGARVRRGWGSLSLLALSTDGSEPQAWAAPTNKAEYCAALDALLKPHHFPTTISGLNFPLTAFAKESRVWVADKLSKTNNVQSETNPLEARWSGSLDCLDWLGRAFLNYRARGQGGSGNVGGQIVQKQFIEDHDWFLDGPQKVDMPYRVAFGLPHNYFKIGTGKGWVDVNKERRRASPMLFHIHKAGSEYFPVVVVLPTKFTNSKITAQSAKGIGSPLAYDLRSGAAPSKTDGLNVLLDFAGKGEGRFKPNQVLSFKDVL
jgi:CRISPR-associated protein Cmr1